MRRGRRSARETAFLRTFPSGKSQQQRGVLQSKAREARLSCVRLILQEKAAEMEVKDNSHLAHLSADVSLTCNILVTAI